MDTPSEHAPDHWIRDLAQSDADIARGDVVPAAQVHARLLEAIRDMEAEMDVSSVR